MTSTSIPALMREIGRTFDGPDLTDSAETLLAERATRLAHELMLLSEERTINPALAATALWRCLAGWYARLCQDAGDPPEYAALALVQTAVVAARLAEQLVADAYERHAHVVTEIKNRRIAGD